ncbi:dynein light chain roadblock-type 1-like [Dermacentor variabilis]|uniref:dynein light chain roadblock-type 1-like n=1 Tax=Dermacentor variabilis TaxID=34621 RepID=UPI003F5C4761
MTSHRGNATATRAKAGGTTSSSEVEDTFLSLHQREGVVGVIATTADGAVIKSTLKDAQETTRYALLAAGVGREANSTTGKLPSFLKMKAGDRVILITPSKKYTLIAVTKISNPYADATQ